jgi:CheY-like chemotaxis protein
MNAIKTIFIVDDDMIYQLFTQKIIENLDSTIDVQLYNDGDEALTALKKMVTEGATLPDIILLDINMPIMDGWEFMEEYVLLKSKLPRPIQIYIVSSSIAESDLKRAKLHTDIIDYVSKPIESDRLAEIVLPESAQNHFSNKERV